MLTYEDLVNDMAAGCKPRRDWRIGIEHEEFAYDLDTGAPLPFEGPKSISAILDGLASRHGWERKPVHGHLIGLKKDGATVTLEPGGQVELSGAPCPTIGAVETQASAYRSDLADVTARLGIGILDAGIHPKWRRQDIHRMPKERYAIMAPYMEMKGRYGVDMMLRTCGAQVNLDFESEADMVLKYRVTVGLQPAITALLANSRIVEGRDSGYKSFRSHIWTDTDPDRCGVPLFVFDADMGFARYVDYALDVPMYFVIRPEGADGHHIDVTGQSFRAFMNGELRGLEGVEPTIEDWRNHLTTLYPEVRLKHYLELRGFDSVSPDLVIAMAALWTGVLYDSAALNRAHGLIADWTPAMHKRLRDEVPREGLSAMLPHGQHLRNLALELIAIAEDGLSRFEPEAVARLKILYQRVADSSL